VPLIESREVDENRDGVVDRVEITVQMPIQDDETIYSASFVAFFDYRVRRWNHKSVMMLVMMMVHLNDVYYPGHVVISWQLRSRANIRMESVAYVSQSSGVAGSSLLVDGDLVLRQAWPFQVG